MSRQQEVELYGLPYHLLSLLRIGLKCLKRKRGIRLRKPHSLLYLLQFVDRVVKVMN